MLQAAGEVSAILLGKQYIAPLQELTDRLPMAYNKPLKYPPWALGDNSVALSSVAYPNPTANMLTLNVNDFNEGNMEYVLFDLQGRELLRQKIKQATTQIQMQHLSASIYLLEIINENKLVKTFKIIKN